MLLEFTKMHALGNDFVMLDLISQAGSLTPQQVRHLADRHCGIGCDQVLAAEAPGHPDADFRCRIYNADGREVGQCGNGVRCFAHFVHARKLTTRNPLQVETGERVLELTLLPNQQVEVELGAPILEPAAIPFRAARQASHYPLQLPAARLQIGVVSLGNPHAVTQVDDIDSATVAQYGPLIAAHKDFPEQVNVGFMQRLSAQKIRLRVFERGVGETRSCGSGACAAVVVGRLQGLLDEHVTVCAPGGELQIAWAGAGHPVIMTGAATTVFEGRIQL